MKDQDWVGAAILALGLVLASLFIANAITDFRAGDRHVADHL